MQSKILVIEDNSAIRAMVETALKEHGCDVIGFDKAKKALDWLAIASADLILIDYSVPEPKPEEICSKIRQNKNHASTPILMFVSLPETKQSDALKKIGVSDFVIKPFHPSDLIEMVDIYLLEKAATSTSSINTKSIPPKKEQKVKREQKEQIDQDDSKDSTLEKILSSTSGIDIDSILIERDGETLEANKGPESINSSEEETADSGRKDKLTFDDIPLVGGSESEGGGEKDHDFGWFLEEMERETQQKKNEPEIPAVKSEAPKAQTPQSKVPDSTPVADKQPSARKDTEEKIVSEERGTGRYVLPDSADSVSPDDSVEQETEKGLMKDEPPHQPAEFNPQIVVEDDKVERFVDAVKDGTKSSGKGLDSLDKVELEKLYSQLTDRLAKKLAGELADKLNADIIKRLLLEELEKVKG